MASASSTKRASTTKHVSSSKRKKTSGSLDIATDIQIQAAAKMKQALQKKVQRTYIDLTLSDGEKENESVKDPLPRDGALMEVQLKRLTELANTVSLQTQEHLIAALEQKTAHQAEELKRVEKELRGRNMSAVAERKELLAAIESSLECGICLAVFTRPSYFSLCGHVFCAKCLEQYIHHRDLVFGGKYSCPTCDVSIRNATVRRSFALQSVVDAWHGLTADTH